MDPDAPQVVQLWERTHTARKERECSVCKERITPGQRYTSTGMRVDGVFEHWVRHENGERYPSGCPKLAAIDRAEAEAAITKDQALWNTAVR